LVGELWARDLKEGKTRMRKNILKERGWDNERYYQDSIISKERETPMKREVSPLSVQGVTVKKKSRGCRVRNRGKELGGFSPPGPHPKNGGEVRKEGPGMKG